VCEYAAGGVALATKGKGQAYLRITRVAKVIKNHRGTNVRGWDLRKKENRIRGEAAWEREVPYFFNYLDREIYKDNDGGPADGLEKTRVKKPPP